ncbi:MAG TPA: MarR family transcriptional regulator [Propionibacteriaceae bacterium]
MASEEWDDSAPSPSGPPPVVNRVRRMMTLFRGVERRLGAQLDLNHTDLLAMEIISRERQVTPSRLAAQLGVTSAAATFVIDRLISAGHVSRQPHPTDRRSTVIATVPESVGQVASLLAPLGVQIWDCYSELDERDRAAVDTFLDNLGDLFEAIVVDEPGSRPRRAKSVD